MSVLSLNHVTKQFGGLRALADVSFEVAAGEIVGLMGANGAGKTTAFGLIAGNLKPTSGTIHFDGARIDGLRPDRVCRMGIARTFQIVRPFAQMTVCDNVAVALMYGAHGMTGRRQAERAALEILADLGLAERAAEPAANLTLAQCKCLEIARALGTGARLLLLDEVMAGLTAAEVARSLELLRRLRDRSGITLLVIEHVMKALMRLCDRIVVLHHGQLVAVGTPAAIAEDPAVIAAYFGRRRT